jgi:tetratricopeptide (TPR) repeat protein
MRLNFVLPLLLIDAAADAVAAAAARERARALLDAGNSLFRAGQHAEAASNYRAVLSFTPDSLEAVSNLGAALATRTQPAGGSGKSPAESAAAADASAVESAALYALAHRLSPASPAVLLNLGSSCSERGLFDEARGWFKKALARIPDGPLRAEVSSEASPALSRVTGRATWR